MIRNVLLSFVLGVFLIAGLFFFRRQSATLREEIWKRLDVDVLYLKKGNVIRGWIWSEDADIIGGLTEENRLFVVRHSECASVQRNKFLHYLDELI